MSFFAGNGKVHITVNPKDITSLNTDTIYADTVFHSNMKSLCSLGEYQVQATVANFTVNSSSEQCFEANIPIEVQNALLDNKVVLVIMGNILRTVGETIPHEAMISTPINIKAGTGGGTLSDDRSYDVVTSPQVTAGGLLDISYSYNSIRNRNISVNALGEQGGTGNPLEATSKVNGWSTDPDYSVGGKVTNLLRPTSRYVQYHARGLRWRLSNTTENPNAQYGVDERPYYTDLSGILAPTFTFIILNARFINNTYQFINPLPNVNSDGIVLQGNNITKNGSKLNSIKVIQSRNPQAIGKFTVGKTLNRIPIPTSYGSASLASPHTRQFKLWSMTNYMQGAKHVNGLPAFMPTTGAEEIFRVWRDNTNYNYSMLDAQYTTHVCDYNVEYNYVLQDPFGYPTPGYMNSANNCYRRKASTILFKETSEIDVQGYMLQKEPFALLDTTKFTSLYITKDGISGEYNGTTIPIWNTMTPPTHMIEGTKDITIPFSSTTRSGLLDNEITHIDIPHDLIYMGFNKTEESILMGVKITDNWLGTNAYRGSYTHKGNDDYFVINWDTKQMSGMYLSDGVVHGLYKLQDGEEIVIGQANLLDAHKWIEQNGTYYPSGVPGMGPSLPNVAIQLFSIATGILYTIKREGNSLRRYTRVQINTSKYEHTIGPEVPALVSQAWTLDTIYTPRINAYVVRIQ